MLVHYLKQIQQMHWILKAKVYGNIHTYVNIKAFHETQLLYMRNRIFIILHIEYL